MKILVATEKPFAPVAIEGIKKEVEGAGHQLVLLEKYTETEQLFEAVKDADAHRDKMPMQWRNLFSDSWYMPSEVSTMARPARN